MLDPAKPFWPQQVQIWCEKTKIKCDNKTLTHVAQDKQIHMSAISISHTVHLAQSFSAQYIYDRVYFTRVLSESPEFPDRVLAWAFPLVSEGTE